MKLRRRGASGSQSGGWSLRRVLGWKFTGRAREEDPMSVCSAEASQKKTKVVVRNGKESAETQHCVDATPKDEPL